MKKTLTLFILLLMIISSFSLTSFAADLTKVSVSDVVAQKQSEVSVPIKISNNQGLWGMVLNVYYDTNIFKLKEIVNNGDVFENSDLLIGPSDFNQGYVRVVITPFNVAENNTSNGTICTLKLNVSEEAELKKYSFIVKVDEACDIDEQNVKVNTASGSVTVQESVESTVQTKPQKQSDSKETKTEKVIVRVEDNKLVEVGDSDETDSAKSDSETKDKTDSSKATEQTKETERTEKVGESVTEEKQGAVDSSSQVAAKSQSGSINYIITIAVVVLIIAAITVLVVALLKRRKNK